MKAYETFRDQLINITVRFLLTSFYYLNCRNKCQRHKDKLQSLLVSSKTKATRNYRLSYS